MHAIARSEATTAMLMMPAMGRSFWILHRRLAKQSASTDAGRLPAESRAAHQERGSSTLCSVDPDTHHRETPSVDGIDFTRAAPAASASEDFDQSGAAAASADADDAAREQDVDGAKILASIFEGDYSPEDCVDILGLQ